MRKFRNTFSVMSYIQLALFMSYNVFSHEKTGYNSAKNKIFKKKNINRKKPKLR